MWQFLGGVFVATLGFAFWFAQQKQSLKVRLFDDAVKSIAFFYADVCDYELQKSKAQINDKERRTYPFFRDEVFASKLWCTALGEVLFPEKTGSEFKLLYAEAVKGMDSISLSYKNGNPVVKGLDEYQTYIKKMQDLGRAFSKELSLTFLVKKWLCNLIRC